MRILDFVEPEWRIWLEGAGLLNIRHAITQHAMKVMQGNTNAILDVVGLSILWTSHFLKQLHRMRAMTMLLRWMIC